MLMHRDQSFGKQVFPFPFVLVQGADFINKENSVRSREPKNNTYPRLHLVHSWQDSPLDLLTIRLPVLAILAPALLLVAHLPMDEEDGEVEHVEVRDGDGGAFDAVGGDEAGSGVHDAWGQFVAGGEGGQAVRPAHDPVAEVVDVAGCSPPAGGQETGAGGGFHVFQMGDFGVVGVGAEAVLLVVRCAEDVVACALDREDHEDVKWPEDDRMHTEVTGLERVDEGHPYKISKGEHETEAVCGDVHGGEDSWFHPESVKDVYCLADCDNNW